MRALHALTKIDVIMCCEGENIIFDLLESSFKGLVLRGLAEESSAGIYKVTDAGREEASFWPG